MAAPSADGEKRSPSEGRPPSGRHTSHHSNHQSPVSTSAGAAPGQSMANTLSMVFRLTCTHSYQQNSRSAKSSLAIHAINQGLPCAYDSRITVLDCTVCTRLSAPQMAAPVSAYQFTHPHVRVSSHLAVGGVIPCGFMTHMARRARTSMTPPINPNPASHNQTLPPSTVRTTQWYTLCHKSNPFPNASSRRNGALVRMD
jgi:hypothetical protein